MIPESQWKAANEARWVSGRQWSTPAAHWLPPPIPHSPSLLSYHTGATLGKLEKCSNEGAVGGQRGNEGRKECEKREEETKRRNTRRKEEKKERLSGRVIVSEGLHDEEIVRSEEANEEAVRREVGNMLTQFAGTTLRFQPVRQ